MTRISPTTKKLIEVRISELVLHSDQQVIAFNKPGGMPTQEDKSGDPSLHRIAQAYCKHDLYIVHRLDRPCSGIVLFAKNKAAAAHLSEQLREQTIYKEYLAVVPKGITPESGTLENELSHRGTKSFVVDNGDGLSASLSYEVTGHIDNYTLLRVRLATGRTHQIRVQLAHFGFPIKGDVKYGARRGNKGRFIHLHGHKLRFMHPSQKEQTEIIAPIPDEAVWNAFDFS